ncbi:MAG: beta-galactosidase [Thiobacillus sp.]
MMIHFLTRKALVLLLACLAFCAPAQASAETLGTDLFGLHVHGLARGGDWPGIDFGYIRLWDAGVLWRDLEPSKGEWKFGLLDHYVDDAQKRGVKVLLTLGQTPKWAASRPDADSPYGAGASSDPRSMDDWRNYVETLATRYKGRIQAWEIWNEANVKHFYSGDYARLAEMERIAAEVLKSVDPANIVLTPSVQGGAFRQLDDYFKAGGGQYADAISYHFYALTEAPEILPERIRKVREVMVRHGLGNKPLWNTEIGWLIPNSDGGFGGNFKPAWHSWRKTETLEAAGFVVRSYLLCLNGGIRHVFWYSWDSSAMGLAESKGRIPKPAARGFARAREWLVGASFSGCSTSGGFWSGDIWSCELERDGKKQWVVWSDAERKFSIPPEWKVVTMQGLFDPAPGAIVGGPSIGPLPVLFSR